MSTLTITAEMFGKFDPEQQVTIIEALTKFFQTSDVSIEAKQGNVYFRTDMDQTSTRYPFGLALFVKELSLDEMTELSLMIPGVAVTNVTGEFSVAVISVAGGTMQGFAEVPVH